MRRGSLFVISDTHLGLRGSVESEPEILGQFLRWLIRLKNGELKRDEAKVKFGPFPPEGSRRSEKTLKPPDKLLMLGDILELWEASDPSIELSSRPIFNLLEKLDCEKIYVLGNHDYDLAPMSGVYPSGNQQLDILKEYYPPQNEEKGKSMNNGASTLRIHGKDYLFLHGYQFDKSFGSFFHPWKHFGGLRSVALAFGGYADIFVFLFVLGMAIGFSYLLLVPYLRSVLGLDLSLLNSVLSLFLFLSNPGLLLILLILSIPRIFFSYGRKVWSKLFGTRYNRKASINGMLRWWERFSKTRDLSDKNLRIVYGHTHHIHVFNLKEPGIQKASKIAGKLTREGKRLFSAVNIPAWVKDSSGGAKYSEMLRATCLYIDDEDELFIGWDWIEKRPFYIPVRTIEDRYGKGTKEKRGIISEKTGKILSKMGWPEKMVDEWRRGDQKK